MFTEDLSLFLADFGVSATLNGSAVTAIVDTSSLVKRRAWTDVRGVCDHIQGPPGAEGAA